MYTTDWELRTMQKKKVHITIRSIKINVYMCRKIWHNDNKNNEAAQ